MSTPNPAAPTAPPDERRPGYTGMWVGITAEFFEFAVFFAVYFFSRWSFPQVFRESAPQLWSLGGLLITVAMLTSGYFLVRTVQAIRADRQRAARVWMTAAFVTALGYPLLKGLEVMWWNPAHGIEPRGNAFFTVYYYLTINHFMHSAWGIMGMVWVTLRVWQGAYGPNNRRAVESMAIYWHATDMVWLMLFSFFYAFV